MNIVDIIDTLEKLRTNTLLFSCDLVVMYYSHLLRIHVFPKVVDAKEKSCLAVAALYDKCTHKADRGFQFYVLSTDRVEPFLSKSDINSECACREFKRSARECSHYKYNGTLKKTTRNSFLIDARKLTRHYPRT